MPEAYLILVLVAGVLGVAAILDNDGRKAGLAVLVLTLAAFVGG